MTQSKNLDPVSKIIDPAKLAKTKKTFSMEPASTTFTRRTAARSWRFEVGNS